MQELMKKENMTSLELTEQINIFRKDMEGKKDLQHYDLLKIIRDEFEEEINDGKISCVSYIGGNGQERPMFILTFEQSKQVLVRESKYVRKAVIAYINKLEDRIKNPPILTTEEILELNFRYSKEIKEKVDNIENVVDNMADIISLNTDNWRKETNSLITKIAINGFGGVDEISTVRNEIYRELENRASCKLDVRLNHRRERMAEIGICKSNREKIGVLDVIEENKALKEIYVAIVKEYAVKYKVKRLA
ncbi:Rha family transcriptional regulator [Peptostreptococcus faecalis]|uniref:hypothetical protein n=1 Tax=Peptostreptococcus faecalis TaxID=2045015 RepID=UPI000C7E5014|nr:hypothetical protein [Peptostreptococcus faecalis]